MSNKMRKKTYHIALIYQAQRISSADGVLRLNSGDSEIGLRQPFGFVQIVNDLLGMSTAEDKNLVDASGFEPGQGVIDHGNIHERQQHLTEKQEQQERVMWRVT